MPVRYFDSHTHVFLEEFKADRELMIEHAVKNHVDRMLVPNIDHATIEPMLAICRKFPSNCFPAIGLHPTSAKEDWADEMKAIESWLAKEKFYAIGEIGMDLYWDKGKVYYQEQAFRHQIRLAQQYGLPMSIHSRNAVHEILEILEESHDTSLRGVFHCFGGNLDEAKKIVSMGFKLGVGGVITFKNSGLDNIIRHLSLDDLILETDSPYLAPVPHRGKRNESSYIPIIAAKIAELMGTSTEKVAEATTRNATDLFKTP